MEANTSEPRGPSRQVRRRIELLARKREAASLKASITKDRRTKPAQRAEKL